MRCLELPSWWLHAGRLGRGSSEVVRTDPAVVAHPPQHDALPTLGRAERTVRIQPSWIFRQPCEKSRFCIGEIGKRLAEVEVRCRYEPDVQVSKVHAVQIFGKDALLAPKLFQSQRRGGLNQLRAKSARPRFRDFGLFWFTAWSQFDRLP